MSEKWMIAREKIKIFKEDMWWKTNSYDHKLPLRTNLSDQRWGEYEAHALIFMEATVLWARIGVHRGWVNREALLKFRKLKGWECADPGEKVARGATLKARARRFARGQTLDLQTRWRGGFQWARNMTEEWGLGGSFLPHGVRGGVGLTTYYRRAAQRRAKKLM